MDEGCWDNFREIGVYTGAFQPHQQRRNTPPPAHSTPIQLYQQHLGPLLCAVCQYHSSFRDIVGRSTLEYAGRGCHHEQARNAPIASQFFRSLQVLPYGSTVLTSLARRIKHLVHRGRGSCVNSTSCAPSYPKPFLFLFFTIFFEIKF